MKKNTFKIARSHILGLIAAFVLAMLLSTSAQAKPLVATNLALSDIYISEVFEANGGTVKYVELYNAGSTAVDLNDVTDDISLKRYTNAGTAVSATIDLTGTIPAGGFYVVGDPTVDGIFGAGTLDQSDAQINHNGNDKYDLFNANGSTILDSFARDNIGNATNFAVNIVAYRVAAQLPNNGDWGDTNQPADDTDSASGYWHVFDITASNGNATAVGTPGTSSGLEAPLGVPQLLISEVVVTPTAGEFVEIYNPGTAPVDLSDVYLTDATFTGSPSTYYYNIVTGIDAGGGGFGDFHARFPDGASIAAGEYQTVALAGSGGFNTTYGVLPTYELFDDTVVDGVPAMREAVAGSINGQGGLTNGGEVAILYYWDGATDLVTDLDYTIWGDTAEAVDKTGVSIDGPDGDSDTSTYLADTAIGSQELISALAHSNGSSWQREDLTEGTETKSGGNGAGGHDETSENLSETFCTFIATPNAVTQCPPTTSTPLKIHEIQGSGSSVTNPGTNATIEGVVVGDYQAATELNGFFVQEEDSDADVDPTTSEGIFVYCGGCAVDVAEGNIVEVTGLQVDFNDMSQIDVVGSTIGAVVVTNAGDNSGLVTAATIDLPVPAGFTNIDDYYEQMEGMLVQVADELTVTEYFELARYGQIILSEGGKPRQFTDANLPDAIGYTAHQDEIARRRIILDDLNNTQNIDPVYHPQAGGFSVSNYVRGGYTVSSLTGVLHYSWPGSGANTFRIRPQQTNPVTFTPANPREAAPVRESSAVIGDIKVASFNVLNYFTTIDVTSSNSSGDCGPSGTLDCRGADSAAELIRQTDKIVAAMEIMDADILGLMEIENDASPGAVAALVNALNTKIGAGTYAYIDTGFIGTDAIKVAIIYKPAVVTPAGSYAVLDDLAFTDPFNTGTDKNRPALAQTFEVTDVSNASLGEAFTYVVNHLKSKGSGCGVGDDDITTGQGNCNATRTAAAAEMLNWLATDPTDTVTNLGVKDTDFLIGGDLNSYRLEDPITTLTGAGYTDLIDSFEGPNAYSYVFSGEWGYLDHSLSSLSLTPQVQDVAVWHINSDEVNLLDYNDTIVDAGEASFEAKPATNPLYADDQYRASDHDPVIVGLNLAKIDTGSLPTYGSASHTFNDQWLGAVWREDDGVVRSGDLWVPNATVSINVDVTNGPGWLACWFDWDSSMTFDGIERMVDEAVVDGANSLTFMVPANAQTGTGNSVNARCRLYPSEPLVCQVAASDLHQGGSATSSSCQGNDAILSDAYPYGQVIGGEVEDYAFEFTPTAVSLQTFGVDQPINMVWLLLLVSVFGLAFSVLVIRKRNGQTLQ